MKRQKEAKFRKSIRGALGHVVELSCTHKYLHIRKRGHKDSIALTREQAEAMRDHLNVWLRKQYNQSVLSEPVKSVQFGMGTTFSESLDSIFFKTRKATK